MMTHIRIVKEGVVVSHLQVITEYKHIPFQSLIPTPNSSADLSALVVLKVYILSKTLFNNKIPSAHNTPS